MVAGAFDSPPAHVIIQIVTVLAFVTFAVWTTAVLLPKGNDDPPTR